MRSERSRTLNIVTLVTAVAASGFLVAGDVVWLCMAIVAAATALGTFLLLAELDPRGVPIESLVTPAVAAGSMTGIASLVGIGLWSVPVLAATAALVAACLDVERRLLGPADAGHQRARAQLLPLGVLLAFCGFVAVAGAVRGGLLVPGEAGAGGTPAGPQLAESGLIVLALADAFIGFLLGYRLAALRAPSVVEASWAAGTFAAMIGVSAALLRAIALPRIVGPAVLAAIFYLWAAYRQASGAERRSAGWLWEYVALAGAAALAIAWNLLLRR